MKIWEMVKELEEKQEKEKSPECICSGTLSIIKPVCPKCNPPEPEWKESFCLRCDQTVRYKKNAPEPEENPGPEWNPTNDPNCICTQRAWPKSNCPVKRHGVGPDTPVVKLEPEEGQGEREDINNLIKKCLHLWEHKFGYDGAALIDFPDGIKPLIERIKTLKDQLREKGK